MMVNANCAMAPQTCAVCAEGRGVSRLRCTLRAALVSTRSAKDILEVANLDLSESSDRRDRLTAVPHPPSNRLQVDEMTHTLAGCVRAHVFIHLIEAHTLPSVNGAQPLEQYTNRGGIVYVGTFKARAFLVRPALRFHRTLARP